MSCARTGAVGTVIGVFVPLSPVVAFLIRHRGGGSSATVLRQRARPADRIASIIC
jgi:hypothetical protein